MNDAEAKELVKKIMHCDQVIHEQQLKVDWRPPTDRFFDFLTDGHHGVTSGGDSSYKGAESETQGKSQMNQNTSIMDSQNQGMSRSELQEDQSIVTGIQPDVKDKYERIKNVFKLLIDEADYLVDDKAMEKCIGASKKDQFKIKIDSIRKSLGIDDLKYVDLLVDVFYKYQKEHDRKIQELLEQEEQEYIALNENGEKNYIPEDVKRGTDVNQPANGAAPAEEQVHDPNKLDLDPDLITKALAHFYTRKEEEALKDVDFNNKKKSKKSNFESEKDQEELKRKSQKLQLQKLVTILTEQKLSVWRALDKSLSKYYQLLVDRQNLIEDTGLLNQ